MSSQSGDVSKGGKELGGGADPTYAGPGTYSFTVNMHVRGNHENVNIWADGTTTYTLDFTHAADASGVRVTAVVAPSGGSTTDLIVGNSGTGTAHNTVLSIGTRLGADTPAAQAIEAYAVDLTANPRDAKTVAAAKKKAQDFPDDVNKHTDDPQCVSSQEVTVCDLGDLGPGASKRFPLKIISFLTDWHVSAAEDPKGESGVVPRTSN
ncbi:hypothetical protein [Streptacidiphilus sp. EB103A]|uniref:hypothetical protein n=1 Tax=Streptacidiphilus sp. EB103A TaxID=3156275 RepID=UPI003516C6F6